MITYGERTYRGCRSENFKGENEEIISLEHLSKNYTGFGLEKTLGRIGDVKERILYTVELVENVTGLEGFGHTAPSPLSPAHQGCGKKAAPPLHDSILPYCSLTEYSGIGRERDWIRRLWRTFG